MPIDTPRSMKFIESVFEKLKRHPKRIVFPEGAEPRVLRAAARFVKLKLGAPVLLGNKAEIEKALSQSARPLGALSSSRADRRKRACYPWISVT